MTTKKKEEEKPKTLQDFFPGISKEAKERLEKAKKKLEKFKKEILDKFDKYIMGIMLLPPKIQGYQQPFSGFQALTKALPNLPSLQTQQPQQVKKPGESISLLVLVDDSDSKKMSKFELKTKLSQIIGKIAKDIDPNIFAETVILSELWQNCYDGKYEILEKIASGIPIHDTGMLSAIKIAEVHKQRVLKKFERYIVCYVLAGSLVQGKATKESDIDVFVVIDDTDVKKMTRIELKDKLRAIIIGMGLEAGEITGIKNKLNIQVYILTDFWENIKEANPIIFTFLRDGIPFYDRGIFMPWKQLLKMGKIKPSPEAIDLFMHSGDQMVSRVKFKLNTIGMDDTFYAILTPSQAALMLYGLPPPTPKETPDLMREVFVKKEKLLEEEYIKILERNIEIRKKLEHGEKKSLTGKEVDKLLEDSTRYLKRIKKLFKQIDKIKERESIIKIYENTITILRDILKLEGVKKIKEHSVIETFEREVIDTGKIPHKYLRMAREILKAKNNYEAGKLTKTDITKIKKFNSELHKFLTEYIQRKRGKEIEKAKIRVKHGKLYGEIYLLNKIAFIVHDIDAEKKQVSKADISEDGRLINIRESSEEELEKTLAEIDMPRKVFIKQPIFEDLKEIFGKDVEVQLSYS